jgi:hypothetical protein
MIAIISATKIVSDKKGEASSNISVDARAFCQNMLTALKKDYVKSLPSSIVNTFNWGLTLFTFS